MLANQKILIVDDDENIAELISLYFEKECFETKCVYSGEAAIIAAKEFNPSLILLDIMLPGIDGYEALRTIRGFSNIPVIMLSAKGEPFDKVLGLKLGADDYIVKPFDANELVARVMAVLRRSGSVDIPPTVDSDHNGEYVEYNDLLINRSNYTVIYQDKHMDMPPKELELLYYLASNPNQVFTREQLLSSIWGYDYMGDTRTVDVHIKRLREKLNNNSQWSIGTVWGIGYKFEVK